MSSTPPTTLDCKLDVTGVSAPSPCSLPVFYSDALVTIYHGDCREIAPLLPVACLMITDPPYGQARYHNGVNGFKFLNLAWAREACVFGWPEKLCEFAILTGRAPNAWVTWWPTNGCLRGFNFNGLWRESEAIAFYGNPKPFAKAKQPRGESTKFAAKTRANGFTANRGVKTDLVTAEHRRLNDVWRDSAPGLGCNSKNRHHPNEKPVAVIARLLDAIKPKSVFDPFMGGGSTLLAAKRAGIKAVGIETEEAHCETAAKRCASELAMGEAENASDQRPRP